MDQNNEKDKIFLDLIENDVKMKSNKDIESPKLSIHLRIKGTLSEYKGKRENNLNTPAKFVAIEEDTFEKVMAVDVKGVFFAVKHELEYMIANGGGTIVNTASVAGLIADPNMAPYVTAKHAVTGLTKAAAIDHAQDGIRVNAVAPGLTETPMTQMWKDNPAVWEEVVSNVPMHRSAKPEEIAEVVVFLSSDAASFCNGYIYAVDGGQVAH